MFSLEQNTYKNARLGDTDFTDAELRGYTFENCDLRGDVFRRFARKMPLFRVRV